jgi:hypothetical protein
MGHYGASVWILGQQQQSEGYIVALCSPSDGYTCHSCMI